MFSRCVIASINWLNKFVNRVDISIIIQKKKLIGPAFPATTFRFPAMVLKRMPDVTHHM